MTGVYLASQIRQRRIRPIIAFREYIFRDVVPQFGRLNERADQIGNEYFDAAINQPVDEDCDGDLSGFAAFCGLYQSQLCKVGILGCGVFLTFEFAAA
jgi:hypothetical protein